MIKVAIKLLMIGLSLSNVLLLECMHVQGPANPADQELINAAEAALNAGANINYADSNGWTALMMAAVYGHIDIVRLFLEQGADVNHADTLGYTALMWAAVYEHTEMVRLLIERGGDVNGANNAGNTALMLAANAGHEDIARLLIEHGADVNLVADRDGFTTLSYVIYKSTIPTAEELQRPNQLNLGIPNLEQPARQFLSEVFEGNELAYAAARGDTKHVVELLSTPSQAQPQSPQAQSLIAQLRKLLASCAILPPAIPPQPLNINHQNTQGMTALHWAAAQGHNNIVKLLLDFGANVNLQNAEGNTPLHLAARNGNLSVVKLLLARGANATVVNRQGQTALALAYRYHHPDVLAFLEAQAGRAVFGRVSQLGRRGGFAWQPTGELLPPEVARQIAQLAQAPVHPTLPSGSHS